MKCRKTMRLLYFVMALILILSNAISGMGFKTVYADGTGTWEEPYTVAQAITIQDGSIATVEGYVVGQPTATNTVITSNFTNDYAIAIADEGGETNTAEMIYVQVASDFRADFGLKSNPGNLGMKVKVTGTLAQYFSPHPGLKNITRIEEVPDRPVTDTESPVITHTPVEAANAGSPIAISVVIEDSSTVTAAVYYGSDGVEFSNITAMTAGDNSEYAAEIPGQPEGNLFYYIEAVDSSGNAAREPADGSHEVIVSAEDIVAPVITHTPVDNAWEGIDIAIHAALIDDSDFTAEVYYGNTSDGNTFTDSVPMAAADGDNYAAIIEDPAAGDLYYYIKAVDAKGNTSTFPADITASCRIGVRDIIDISEARTKAPGAAVTVKGIVTYKDGSNYYIQDNTGAIDIYKSGLTLAVGDEAIATGPLASYNGLLEITPTNTGDVLTLSSNNILPEPKLVTIPDINESLESQLIKVEKVTLGTVNTSGNTEITDEDGNKINIYKIPVLTDIAAGDIVDVTAIVSEYKTVYQLRVRSAEDVSKPVLEPDVNPPTIEHTPVAEGNTGADLAISATISDDKRVQYCAVYYRTQGTADYSRLDMANTSGSEYTAAIPKENLAVPGLEYYIEAGDGTNVVTTPIDKNSPYQVAISFVDVEGPEIKDIVPEAGSYTGDDVRPVISASYSDASGIDINSVKLYLDENDVTSGAAVTATVVSYTPEQDLSEGSHSVRLEVSDTKGNKSEKSWTFNVGNETYNLYFGQLHAHSNFSDGQGTPTEAFDWAKNVAKADFFALTDHSNSFDNDTANGNIDDWRDSTSTEWKQVHEIADSFNEDGEFAAIAGFEMTWSGSTGGWGHINTFNTGWFESRNNSAMDLKAYYEKISADPDSISQLNHPGTTFGDFDDFGYYSKAADEVIHLIEVGNGEGEIGEAGYFPSYEYYTRALDKGWHLAPTNNQDNHLANWVTANEARTVVLAPSLTRESIYDAIRAMRVYATEDSNLRINFAVNGRPMGTILEDPENLDFNISFEDPDASDNLHKVSIICDGGITAAEKTFESNAGVWELQLDPQYTYYYVRIDQGDQNIAVTAPVWTGEVVPVGLSNVEVSLDPTIVNTPVRIDATVYNNGSEAISNITVEFFKDSIASENKIGEDLINSVEIGGIGTASVEWTPDKAGSYYIYAKAVINYDGLEKIFTQSTGINVENEEDVIKVVIDAGHYNQYVSGDYAGKIITLKQMLKEKKYMLMENPDEITEEDLEGVQLLMLTDPQSKDDTRYNLLRSLYSDAEAEAIKQYMDKGGALIITSRADYNDKGVLEEQYESAAQGNKILEAIGSSLRFNDDEVIDWTSNGGQEYRLYFDDYASSIYNLTGNIPEGQTYSFYSGCSVIPASFANEENVDWLVKGHDTTETYDSDLQNDNTLVEKGDVRAIAAEVLPSGAKLIVAGTTFFSDFETASVDNAYSNKQITANIIDWMVQPKPVELKTIAEVRADEDKDGVPDLLGKKFSVEGRVTAQSTAIGTNNAFFDVIYVQDDTGGITVFGVSSKPVPLGVKVKVTGWVDQYDGDTELQVSNEDTDVEITDSTIELAEPVTMSTAESMLEENEGWLVKTQGIVTGITDNTLYLNDGSGEARIYVNGYIGDGTDNPDRLGKWDSSIKVGDTVSAIGLASQDAGGHRLRVRNTAEIVKNSVPVTGISIDRTAVSMKVGETVILKATVFPENASNKNVSWTSSNNFIATVNGGLVKGNSTGTTIISAVSQDGNFKANCTVTVTYASTDRDEDEDGDTPEVPQAPVTPSVPPVQVEIEDTAINTTIIEDTAEVNVQAGAIAEAAKLAQRNAAGNGSGPVVNMNVQIADEVKNVSVKLTADAISSLSENNTALKIDIGAASIQMSSDLMASFPKNTDIKLEIKREDPNDVIKNLPEGFRAAGSGIDFSFRDDSDSIKGSIVVGVRLESDANGELLGLYYYNEVTGELTFIGGRVSEGKIIGITEHNSKYFIMEYSRQFKDIKPDSPYNRCLNSMVAKHVINGYADGTFKGDNYINRSEVAIMLCRTLEMKPVKYMGAFDDVSAKNFSAGYIQKMYDMNIMKGVEGRLFKPNNTVSGEEMYKMMGLAAGVEDYSKKGTVNYIFKSKSKLTRYEAAAMIFELYNTLSTK